MEHIEESIDDNSKRNCHEEGNRREKDVDEGEPAKHTKKWHNVYKTKQNIQSW